MQSNGQDQTEDRPPQQTNEQQEQKGEPNSDSAPTEAGQQTDMEQQKVQECMDQLRRTQADFMNYRRRMNQDLAEARISAQAELLQHLLPVYDDIGRAIEAAPQELYQHPWVQGLFLILRRLTMQLDQLGVQQIGAPDKLFDPHIHEAIASEVRTDVPEGTILNVVQKGFALGDRIIRPAQVTVAVSPPHIQNVPVHQVGSDETGSQ